MRVYDQLIACQIRRIRSIPEIDKVKRYMIALKRAEPAVHAGLPKRPVPQVKFPVPGIVPVGKDGHPGPTGMAGDAVRLSEFLMYPF